MIDKEMEKTMSQTIIMILHVHEKDAENFECLLQGNVLPKWEEMDD